MLILRRAGQLLVAGSALLFLSAAAEAQPVRFVRSNGNDANACTLAAPCRTLQRAVAVAPARGEVEVLDSGNFGPGVIISKSLTISGDGATVMLAGPIEINSATAKVTLRDLLLNGRGVTLSGLIVKSAASVHVVGCEFERFAESGAEITSANAEAYVTDSTFRNNGDQGLFVAARHLSVEDSRFEDNGSTGLQVFDARASVARSTFSGNGGNGFTLIGGRAAVAWSTASGNDTGGYVALPLNNTSFGILQVESSVAHGNGGPGIFVNDDATAVISNLNVSSNAIGIENRGRILSRQNNTVAGNVTNFVGSEMETESAD